MVIELSDRLGMLLMVLRLPSDAKAEKTRLSPLAGTALGDQFAAVLQFESEPAPSQVSCAGVTRSSSGSTWRIDRNWPARSRPVLLPRACGKSRESHRRQVLDLMVGRFRVCALFRGQRIPSSAPR